MARNKTKIRIVEIENHGRCHDMWCDRILWLRKARQVGDEEVVNNTVLGKLKEAQNQGHLQFEIID